MDGTFAVSAPGPSRIKKGQTAKTKKTTEEMPPTEKKKTTIELVCEAIEVVGVERKGASAQAIKKYVTNKTEPGSTVRLNLMVNKALVKGIEKGILSRPHNKKDAIGATGHFVLVKKKGEKKAKSTIKKRNSEDQASDGEITTKSAQKMKRYLSDSALNKNRPITSTPKVSQTKRPVALKDPKTKKATAKKKTNDRKDSSDTEVVVKKKVRKSLKSYSSDTEVDAIQKDAAVKTIESTQKKIKSKPKAEKPEPESQPSKPKPSKKRNIPKPTVAKDTAKTAKTKKEKA